METDAEPKTPEQQMADESDFLKGAVSSFLQKRSKWSMNNIMPAYRAFTERLRTYETNQGQPMHDNCFVALELLPSVLFFIMGQLFADLPDSCQLTTDRQAEFVLSLLGLMDPENYPRGMTMVQNFEDLLKPSRDAQWSRALHDDIALHLRAKAETALGNYSDGLQQLPEAERASYTQLYEQEHPEFHGQRLFEVQNGHFPCGFNTFGEQRYDYFDMRFLLFPTDPEQPDAKSLKVITHETNNYLLRTAAEMIDLETAREDQNRELIEHWQSLLDRGYPEGYKILADTSERFQEF